MDQSGASDHDIPSWNMLLLSQYIPVNITECF